MRNLLTRATAADDDDDSAPCVCVCVCGRATKEFQEHTHNNSLGFGRNKGGLLLFYSLICRQSARKDLKKSTRA